MKVSVCLKTILGLFLMLLFVRPLDARERKNILLICIDGMTWNVITPLIKEGKLPNISRMMQEGSYGELICDPPFSPPSWTSIATGKSLQKHGVTDFQSPARNTQALWNILSGRNIKSAVINWLMASPMEKIDGVMFCPTILGVEGGKRYVETMFYPPSLRNEVEKNVELAEAPTFIDREIYEFLNASDVNLIRISSYLIQEYNPELCAIGFLGTNPYQHRYWSGMEPALFDISKEEVEEKGRLIENYYIKIDRFLSYFLDEGYIIIMVSDHGFNRNDLRSGPRIVKYYNRNSDMQHINFLCNYMLYRLGLLNFNHAPSMLLERDIAVAIDFTTTKAYFYNDITTGMQGIKLAESLSVVKSNNNLEQLKERIYTILRDAHFKTGEKVFMGVQKTNFDENANGPDVTFKLSPLFRKENLVFKAKNGMQIDFDCLRNENGERLFKIILENEEYDLGDFIDFSRTGSHEIEGVIIMYGRHVRKNQIIQEARNIDITPTILYLFDIPIGKDMDGRVLIEVIDAGLLKKRPIKYIETFDKAKIAYDLTFMPDDDTVERLRSLGYLH